MCGRVRLTSDYTEIKVAFRLPPHQPPLNFPERWNGAPTQQYPFIRLGDGGSRAVDLFKWGLIPAWAKDEKIGYSTFNARSEELASKPSYRAAWKAGRRGVLPLTGFYEWKNVGPKEKQPYLITRADGAMMAVAGLWETKQLDGGETLRTFTIVTTAANKFMAQVHDRMPVILAMEDVPAWLGEETIELDHAAALMRSAPDDVLQMVPVDRRMSNMRNWQAEYCQPERLNPDGSG